MAVSINIRICNQKWKIRYQNVAGQEHGQAYSDTSGFDFWFLTEVYVEDEDYSDESQ